MQNIGLLVSVTVYEHTNYRDKNTYSCAKNPNHQEKMGLSFKGKRVLHHFLVVFLGKVWPQSLSTVCLHLCNEFVTNSCSQLQTQMQKNFLSLIFSLFAGRTFLIDSFIETPLPKITSEGLVWDAQRSRNMQIATTCKTFGLGDVSLSHRDLVLQSRSLSSVAVRCLNHKIVLLSHPLISCSTD